MAASAGTIIVDILEAEQVLAGLIALFPNPQDTVSRILARMQQTGASQDPTKAEQDSLKADAAAAASDEPPAAQ